MPASGFNSGKTLTVLYFETDLQCWVHRCWTRRHLHTTVLKSTPACLGAVDQPQRIGGNPVCLSSPGDPLTPAELRSSALVTQLPSLWVLLLFLAAANLRCTLTSRYGARSFLRGEIYVERETNAERFGGLPRGFLAANCRFKILGLATRV